MREFVGHKNEARKQKIFDNYFDEKSRKSKKTKDRSIFNLFEFFIQVVGHQTSFK